MKKFLLSGSLHVVTAAFTFAARYLHFEGIDINLHDTYIIVASSYLADIFSLWLLFVALVFFLFHFFKKPLFFVPALLQYIFTISFILSLGFALSFFTDVKHNPHSYPDDIHDAFLMVNYALALLTILFLIGQIIFVGNIIITLFTRNPDEPK